MRVADYNHTHDRGWAWSQMENLGEGKLSGLSALPEETHQHQKMPFSAVIAVVPELVEGS